jgi:hypothetical protein
MKLVVQSLGNAKNYFFPYGGRVLSSRNFLKISTRWSSCSSSHFVTMLTRLTGGKGEWVETTCLRGGGGGGGSCVEWKNMTSMIW